jgi:hypothetical protein
MTDTQGSAKPPPWVESGTRFAVSPTGLLGVECNGALGIDIKPTGGSAGAAETGALATAEFNSPSLRSRCVAA